MFTHHIASASLNVRQNSHLRRLERVLEDQGLMAVLESLPSPDALTFEKTKRLGYDAISIFLGDRPKSYGGKGQSWACILLENKNIKPPVVFYDQETSKEEGRTRAFRYPRSASSLLRKASDLRPPFCFLQHDPHNDMKDMRNMLCAIILYQAVKAGVNTCALRWTQFEHGLRQALRYIDSHGAYREWRHGQKITSLKPPQTNRARKQVKLKGLGKEEENEEKEEEEEGEKEKRAMGKAQPAVIPVEKNRTLNGVDEDNFTGGAVRSTGSGMIIQPGTGLSKLRKLMGKKFELIDYIPATPISISRHTFSTALFAFRLQLGTHDRGRNSSLPIYVYPAHDGKNVMRILDSEGRELTKPLTFENLEGVNLLQPFATLWANEVGAKSKARAAKLRYMVSYYLLLAENQGLIGVPPVTISEVFGQKMCAACNELRQAKTRDSDKGKEIEDSSDGGLNDDSVIDTSSNMPPESTGEPDEESDQLTRNKEENEGPSHIVVLKLRPRVLIEIIRSGPPKCRGELVDSGFELDRFETGYDELPLEVAPDYDLHTFQFEVLPSSQRFHEPSEPLLASLFDAIGDRRAPVIANEMEAPSRDVDNEQLNSFNAITMSGKERTEGQSAAETTAESMHVAIRGNIFSIKSTAIADSRIDDREANRRPPIDEFTQDLHSKAPQNESDHEFMPMDISSSSSPTTSRSHTPAILVNETRASSVSNGSVVSKFDASAHVEKVPNDKSANLEQTVGRDLEAQAAPAVVDHPDVFVVFPKIIALPEGSRLVDSRVPTSNKKVQRVPKICSQIGKGWQAGRIITFLRNQSSKSRNKAEQAPTVNTQTCAEIDLRPLSSSPRGKKRKSTLEFDSDDGVVEEVDYEGWSKVFRNRQEVQTVCKSHNKHGQSLDV